MKNLLFDNEPTPTLDTIIAKVRFAALCKGLILLSPHGDKCTDTTGKSLVEFVEMTSDSMLHDAYGDALENATSGIYNGDDSENVNSEFYTDELTPAELRELAKLEEIEMALINEIEA